MAFELRDDAFQKKDLEDISSEDILKMRRALDESSMSLLKERNPDDPNSFLNIDFPNRFIIESFNYFGTEGLAKLFQNTEFKLPGMTAKIKSFKLTRPTDWEIGDGQKPLYPNDAVRSKISYVGELLVTIVVNSPGYDEMTITEVPFGYIPICVGSAFCNLTDPQLIKSLEDYQDVGGCSTEFLGYFVVTGNKYHFISQNYLKDNTPICRVRKYKIDEEKHLYTNCDLKSRGINGSIYKVSCFIMNGSGAKMNRNDSKIYVQIGAFVKETFYPTSKSVPDGMNLMDVYRLSINLMKYYDPFMPDRALNFLLEEPIPNWKDEFLYSFVQSHDEAEKLCTDLLKKHLGEEVYNMAHLYIENTVNEASIIKTEKSFWGMIAKVTNPASVSKNSLISIREQGIKAMEEFGRAFFPHIAGTVFDKLGAELLYMKKVLREQLQLWINAKSPPKDYSIISNEEIKRVEDVDLVLFAYKGEMSKFSDEEKANILKWDLATFFNSPDIMQIHNKYKLLQDDFQQKLEMLSHMVARFLRSVIELDPIDDIDSLANQIYEPAGEMILSRFGSMLRDIKMELSRSKIVYDAKNIKQVFTESAKRNITAQFIGSFKSNEWNKITMKSGPNTKKRTGIFGIMPVTGPIAEVSALGRLSSASSDQSTILTDREISGLQTGFICPAETSEGKQCGRVVNLAASAIITGHSYDGDVWMVKLAQKRTSKIRSGASGQLDYYDRVQQVFQGNYTKENTLQAFSKYITDRDLSELSEEEKAIYLISRNPTKERKCFFMLDGIPMGWVEGLKMRKTLIQYRRNGIINPMTGIHFNQRVTAGGLYQVLKMETRASRIVQPLIIAEDPQKTVNLLWHMYLQAQKGYSYTITDLFEAGYIEFIDSAELEFLDLSPSGSDYMRSIQDGNPYRYDHIMINPAFLMGFTANMQPFSNMNPPVRTSYFTAMGKQAPSGISPSFIMRGDTGISRLLTAQEPLVSTDVYGKIFDNNYFGMNVNVLIATDRENEEDGIAVREGFVRDGGLSSIKYEAYPLTYKSEWNLDYGGETFNDPDRFGKGTIRVTKQVIKVDAETGKEYMVEEPVTVKNKEVLARAMSAENNGPERLMEEIKYESLREGIVDRIMFSKGTKGSKIAYIVIKHYDNIWKGDKLASRFSQKGVVVKVIPDDQMYYDAETGEKPDLIINPQGFPSRMTVGMMAELLVGTAYIRPDLNKTVSVLYNKKGLDIFARIERLFLVNSQAYRDASQQVEDLSEVSPVLYPSKSALSPNTIMGTLSGQRADPESPNFSRISDSTTTLISSSSVYSQEQLNILRTLDLARSVSEQEEGILALKIYGTPKPFEESLEVDDEVSPTKDVRYILLILTQGAGPIKQVLLNDPRVQPWYKMSPELRSRMAFVLEVPISFVETIPGLFEDTETDLMGKRLNPMKGIRISNLPRDNLAVSQNVLSHLGNTVHDIYVKGNTFTPVARQTICDYKPSFFLRGNLDFYFVDYTIPKDMRELTEVQLEGEKEFQTLTLTDGIKMSILKAETQKIRAKETILKSDQPNAPLVETIVDTTVYDLWIRRYGKEVVIPRENVIDLPESPSDLFKTRRDKLNDLRKGNAFKEGMDLSDAKKELSMMGYNMDLTKRFIDGRTGKEVKGGLVGGSIYYMALKHKVKDKIQSRGIGSYDMRLGQPNKGKVNGGGIRFNQQDSFTIRRTGANAVLLDRLRDASGGRMFYVCTDCQNTCYKIGRGERQGSIYCNSCKSSGNAAKIHVQYVTMYMMNLLKGAGMSVKYATRTLTQGENDEEED